jgi:hypothetical protein
MFLEIITDACGLFEMLVLYFLLSSSETVVHFACYICSLAWLLVLAKYPLCVCLLTLCLLGSNRFTLAFACVSSALLL